MFIAAFVIALAQASISTAPSKDTGQVGCAISADERSRLLALDFRGFDQSPDGWRLYGSGRCGRLAAELIETYIDQHQPPERDEETLLFHQAQNLANANERAPAAKILQRVQILKAKRNGDRGGQLYVEATRAFLMSDRTAFDRAIDGLRQYASSAEKFAFYSRANLVIVEGLGRCFNLGYLEAYTAPCVDMSAMAAARQSAISPSQTPSRP